MVVSYIFIKKKFVSFYLLYYLLIVMQFVMLSSQNLVTFLFLNFIYNISLQVVNIKWLVEGKGWIYYIKYICFIATGNLLVIFFTKIILILNLYKK
jgi:hypothetical protein